MSDRAIEDARLLRLIRASYKASHGIYGAPRMFQDLREAGETCSKLRVERLHKFNRITNYRRAAAAVHRRIPIDQIRADPLCTGWGILLRHFGDAANFLD